MKRILRHFVINTVSIFLVSSIAQGLVFEKGIETLIYTGLALTLASIIAKPLINLLLLPVNLITFGLFRWVSGAVVLYIVSLVVPGFAITGFIFPGYSNVWFDIPSFSFEGFVAIIAFSFLNSFISSFIYWLVK